MALLVSEIQEQFAAFGQFRARNLKKSIQILLQEESFRDKLKREENLVSKSKLWDLITSAWYLIRSLWDPKRAERNSLTESIYKHSQIASLNQYTNRLTGSSVGASYIPKEVFSQALIDVLLTQKSKEEFTNFDTLDLDLFSEKINDFYIDNATKQLLNELIRLSTIKNPKATFEDFKKELENLFDQAQERTSGVYKRNAKGVSLIIGLIVAGISNADAFNIVHTLAQDSNNTSSTIASQLTSKLQELQCPDNDNQEEYEKCIKGLTPQLRDLFDDVNTEVPLPIGWNYQERIDEKQSKRQDDKKQLEVKLTIHDLDKNISNNALLISELTTTIKCFDDTIKDKPSEESNQPKPDLEEQQSCFDKFVDRLAIGKDDLVHNIYIDKLLEFDQTAIEESKKSLEKSKKSLQKEQLSLIAERIKRQSELNKENDTNSVQIENIFGIIDEQGGWGKVGLGWCISAIAISMGAPFWFDLLAKVMNVRNAGKPPEIKQNEGSSGSEN